MVASIKMNFLQKAIIPSLFVPCMKLPALLEGLPHGGGDLVILSVLGRDIPQAAGAHLSLQCAGERGWHWSFGGKGAAHQPCSTLSQLMGQYGGTAFLFQGIMQAEAGKMLKDMFKL